MRSRRILLRAVIVTVFLVRTLYARLISLVAVSTPGQCHFVDTEYSGDNAVTTAEGRPSRRFVGIVAGGLFRSNSDDGRSS